MSGNTTQLCERCQAGACPLFPLRDRAVAWPASLPAKTFHRFQARQTVFHQGTPATTVHILCQGAVKLFVAGPVGTGRIVQILSAAREPGDILDKASLGIQVHSLSCETLTECHICCLSRSDLVWLSRQEPELADRLLCTVSAELRALLEHFRDGSAVHVRQRLAGVLITMAERHGLPSPHGIELDLALRRQEWAELIGTSRETVARVLNDLCRERVLALSGRRITIIGHDRLAKLAVCRQS